MLQRVIALTGVLAALIVVPADAEVTKPPVVWKPAYSGNYTKKSAPREIKYVVIHTTEGSGNGAASWFQNPASKVSAHYIVQFSGVVQQCVADKDVAWHAGNSLYNAKSIGIEHAGYAYKNKWTEAQYKTSAQLTRWLCLTYGIPMDREHIVAHFEVPGASHTDPGPFFRWDYYMYMVKTADFGYPVPDPNLWAIPVAIDTDIVNVRRGPSASAAVMGKAKLDQVYISPEDNEGWVKFYYDGKAGWCHYSYLAPYFGPGTAVKITSDTLNVRAGPGVGYTRYGVAYGGQLYWKIGAASGWHKIWFRGSSYWIHGGYASEVDEP